MKKLLILATFMAWLISITPVGATWDDFFTVTDIQNDQITIKDSKGHLKTLPAGSQGLKVGDKVKIVDNKVRSWDWGNKPSQGVKPPAAQRSLPFDDGSRAPR